jgi:hypothetical protein
LKKARRSVAFFAYLSKNLSKLGKGTQLVYDVVNLNDGNGYNKADGTFTAPSGGLYVFHVSTGAIDNSYAVMELVLNIYIRKDVVYYIPLALNLLYVLRLIRLKSKYIVLMRLD